jgi:Zn-finger nucleic acid-binding protein
VYRDIRLSCPRCRVELDRKNRRESWRCSRCLGFAVETGTVVRKLYMISPDLVPGGGADGLPTYPRRNAQVLPCAACGKPMRPVRLQGVEIDRCYQDEMIWFDPDELDQVLTSAIERMDTRRSWIGRLLDRLYAN